MNTGYLGPEPARYLRSLRERVAIARLAVDTAGFGYSVGKTGVVWSIDRALHMRKSNCLRAFPVPSYANPTVCCSAIAVVRPFQSERQQWRAEQTLPPRIQEVLPDKSL